MAEQLLPGKVPFITGAAAGIGFATAKAFAEAGVMKSAGDVNAHGHKALRARLFFEREGLPRGACAALMLEFRKFRHNLDSDPDRNVDFGPVMGQLMNKPKRVLSENENGDVVLTMTRDDFAEVLFM
jgi:NAD(P)-dependent dehydrogenase (short-subunit alcohol dehydrogenase family)